MTKALLTNILILSIILAITASCQKNDQSKAKSEQKQAEKKAVKMNTIDIKSTAFTESDTIPVKYTCDGQDLSTPLSWSGVPEDAKSLALICDDPDAPMGTWVHWVLFNIPPDVTELSEGVSIKDDEKLSGAIEGTTDFNKANYGGPCPPPGPAHRYYFKLYALDTILELNEKAVKADVEKAMADHILAQGQLMGKYQRQR